MSDTARTFHVGDIISITDGHLVSPEHVGGVYKILGHLCGEALMTHQLPRVAREAKPYLREQFPDVASVVVPDDLVPDGATKEEARQAVSAWMLGVVAEHGETRDVEPMPTTDHTSIDPISELKMMRPDVQVITLDTTPEDDR